MDNGVGRGGCSVSSSQMIDLLEAVKDNSTSISNLENQISALVTLYREMTRWLLIVVCIIALGSKLLEMANNIWGKASTTTTESKS